MIRRSWMVPLFILTCMLLAHHGSFFTYFDDETIRFFILDRNDIYYFPGCLWGNWINLPVASQTYRPLMTISFLVERMMYGGAAWGYHLTNFLLHYFAVLAFIRLAALTTPGKKSLPAAAALFFALHPLATQPLWILGDRAETAVLLFNSLAVIFFTTAIRDHRPFRYPVALGCFFLSLSCKETAITLPLLLLLADWLLPNQKSRIKLTSRAIPHLPFWGLLAGYILFRAWLFSGLGGYSSFSHLAFLHTPGILCQDFDWMWIVPLGQKHLCIIYPIMFLLFLHPRWPISVRFGNLWTAITLLPVLNLCQKWYLYSPLAGWALVLAGLLTTTGRRLPRARLIMVAIISLTLGLGSHAELTSQRRTAAAAAAAVTAVRETLPEVSRGATVRFLLPPGVPMSRLTGHFFRIKGFQVEKYPSPLRGIVKDLNQTRYLDGRPIFNRLVQSRLRLEYNDPELRAELAADTIRTPRTGSRVVTFQLHPETFTWEYQP
ncbi:hypothetical protein JW905_08140 [bacterium]|nr:hypothetical protein [candidate division CSSED10-310 bacterium]